MPDPLNPHTTIEFWLPKTGRAVLNVFDASGRRVRQLVDEVFEPGAYRATWDGRNDQGHPMASGVYFFRLVGAGNKATKRALLLR